MTHDWFFHGENSAENPIEVPLPAGDSMGSGTESASYPTGYHPHRL